MSSLARFPVVLNVSRVVLQRATIIETSPRTAQWCMEESWFSSWSPRRAVTTCVGRCYSPPPPPSRLKVTTGYYRLTPEVNYISCYPGRCICTSVSCAKLPALSSL
ncbi:hypothetical protein J6590_053138 [Homalodisca vitripennis]|nr:hypothetical protein J6590_053138 [Homalodisca vitripennis]